MCVVASCAPPTGDLVCNLGMWPDWKSNQQPFGSQAGTQSTEQHQPGISFSFNSGRSLFSTLGPTSSPQRQLRTEVEEFYLGGSWNPEQGLADEATELMNRIQI